MPSRSRSSAGLDTGEHEELRRVENAAAADHGFARHHAAELTRLVAGGNVRTIKTLTTQVFDAHGFVLALEKKAGGESIERDEQPSRKTRLRLQQPFPRAHALMVPRAQGDVVQTVGLHAPVVWIAIAGEQPIDIANRVAAFPESAAECLQQRIHQIAICESVCGQRLLDLQPAVPAMTAGIESELGQLTQERPMSASLDSLPVLQHVRRAP